MRYKIFLFLYARSIKPSLRKVSKYENKFAKLQKKAAEFNFRNQLKQVKKKEFTMEEEDKEVWVFKKFVWRVLIVCCLTCLLFNKLDHLFV